MTAVGSVYVEDPDVQLLSYTSVRVYRGSTSNPATAAFTTLVTTIPLVASTETYAFTDASGTSNTVWRCSYYHTGTTAESGLGLPIFPVGARTLRTIRTEAVKRFKGGSVGLCSGVGSTTSLVDAALRDSGVGTGFLEGAWVFRPDAAATGDRVRRVKTNGFETSTGTLSFDRQYTNAPASGEAYELYPMYPPEDAPGASYSWASAVRDGLEHAYFEDQVNLGSGSSTGQTLFPLTPHVSLIDRYHIRRVLIRTTDSNGNQYNRDADKRGSWWDVRANGPADLAIELGITPGTSEDVILECVRSDSAVYTDTDSTAAPIELAIRGTLWAIYEQANIDQPGKYQRELMGARNRFIQLGGRLPAPAVTKG